MPRSLRPHQQRALSAAALGVAIVLTASSAAGALTPRLARRASTPAQASTQTVTVSPLPGTPDASAGTQISFLGGPETTVADVRVDGSQSGHHTGILERYSTGTGESFMPARPFTPGEHVEVSARVTQNGSSSSVRTHFTVAFQATFSQAEFPSIRGSAAAVQHYLSAPSITPSTVTITTPAGSGATPGDFFLAPYQGAGTPGPMIVDQSGNLIWFDPLPSGEAATDFHPQTYEGRRVLTWWQGRILGLGFGQGEDEIYNSSYEPLARVLAGNGYHADLHQFLLTSQGTAWIDAVDPVDLDLAGIGGPRRGVVSDSIVQEIDVRTGLVMWEWHALGHIPLRDSYAPVPHSTHPWDYAHVNSVDPGPSGTLLVSARNTWAIYYLDLHTGRFIWQLGGKRSSFRLAPGTAFHYQHDASWQPGGLVSLFDNGGTEEKQSRGLVLDPNTARRTVTLIRQFTNPNATLLTASQGNLLRLSAGNWLMGYGGLPNFTEYDSSGRVILDATLGPAVQDYRTYLAAWSAQPKTVPTVAVQSGANGALTVEASWNGATSVSAWELLAGPSAASLSEVETVPSQGFQTSFTLAAPAPQIAVAALGSNGQRLAISAAVASPR